MSEGRDDRLKRGWEQFQRMAGEERAQQARDEWSRISPDFERFVLAVVGGEVWTRDGLDLRTRSLVTISALAALGRTRALGLNIEMALKNGATRAEIRETMLQLAFYAGFPAAWEALQLADEVFRRADEQGTS